MSDWSRPCRTAHSWGPVYSTGYEELRQQCARCGAWRRVRVLATGEIADAAKALAD
jgi:hypothetical protein